MQREHKEEIPLCDVSGFRIGVVAARFNHEVTDKLLAGAREELLRKGVREENIRTVRVAGCAEIPSALQVLAEAKKYDALVALGAIIRGETPHFEYVAKIVSEGILRVSLDYKITVGFGILTTHTEEQAMARLGVAKHAALAPLEVACLKKEKSR